MKVLLIAFALLACVAAATVADGEKQKKSEEALHREVEAAFKS